MTGRSPADTKGNGWWVSCKGKQQFYLPDLQARVGFAFNKKNCFGFLSREKAPL